MLSRQVQWWYATSPCLHDWQQFRCRRSSKHKALAYCSVPRQVALARSRPKVCRWWECVAHPTPANFGVVGRGCRKRHARISRNGKRCFSYGVILLRLGGGMYPLAGCRNPFRRRRVGRRVSQCHGHVSSRLSAKPSSANSPLRTGRGVMMRRCQHCSTSCVPWQRADTACVTLCT